MATKMKIKLKRKKKRKKETMTFCKICPKQIYLKRKLLFLY